MFEVAPDHHLRMLRIALRGFWDNATMADYMKVVREAIGGLQRVGGCRYILIDMTGYPIQSQEIAEGHAAALRIVTQAGDIRVALVMQSALSKLQASRVAADTGQRMFDTENAAQEWLLSDRA
jgi:serine/threonine-protein kinase